MDPEFKKVVKLVSEEKVSRWTKELIRIPSENPPGNYVEISKYIASLWKGLGLDVQLVEVPMERVREAGLDTPRMNVVGRLRGSKSDGRGLVLDCHMDTVPAGKGWSVEPYAGIEKDGRIYGRGTSDIKGGLAVMTAAADAIVQSGMALKDGLTLVATADDEIGSPLGAKYLLEEGIIKPSYSIVGEGTQNTVNGTGLDIVTTFGGRIWVEVATAGKSAHGGAPQHGINAIEKMMGFLQYVKANLKVKPHPLYPPTYNLGTIQGGVKTNVVPDRCIATLDLRFGPIETCENIMNQLKTLTEEYAKVDKEFKVDTLKEFEARDGFEVNTESPLVNSLIRNSTAMTGVAPRYVKAIGSGNSFRYWEMGRIPSVFFGPGNDTLHKADEFVEKEMLVKASKVYVMTVLDLCG